MDETGTATIPKNGQPIEGNQHQLFPWNAKTRLTNDSLPVACYGYKMQHMYYIRILNYHFINIRQ